MLSWLNVMNRSEGPYTTPVDANQRVRHRMEEDPGAGARAGQRGQRAGSNGIALFRTTFE